MPADYLATLREKGISYVVVGESSVDLAEAKHLNQHRSITNIIEQPGAKQPGRLLTKRELAGFLGMGERFIELEVRRGCLRAVRLSNRDWIDQQVEQLSSSLCDLASAHGFS